MIKGAYTNIQSNTKIDYLLSDSFFLYEEFARVVQSHTVMDEVPAILIDVNRRIKRVQIGDHEIKQ